MNTTITDVQLYPERHIAFIGFFDGDVADIKRRFDGTYLGSTKISVYAALSHQQAIQEGRKRGVWKQREEQQFQGQQKSINELYASGGDILQKYLDYSQQKKWQNDLIMSQNMQQGDAPQFQSAKQQNPSNLTDNNKKQIKQQEKDPFKIKITNLPNTADENRLLDIFKQYDVQSINVGQNPLSGELLGFAFLVFKSTGTVKRLIKTAEMQIDGKFCKIEAANVDSKENEERRAKFIPRALDAQNKSAWNAYIHNTRTLQGLIGQKLTNQNLNGLKLNSEQISQVIQKDAVTVASGEALINQELKEARKAVGLQDEGPRSRHTLLVKNIPPDVGENDIETIFQTYGVIKYCNLFFPGFALVSFIQPADARKALGKVAFKRVGASKSPLMLEFAIGKSIDDYEKDNQQNDQQNKENSEEKDKTQKTTIIYITNIAATTTTEQFEDVLIKKLGNKLLSCELFQAAGIKTSGKALVQPDDASTAIRIISQIMHSGNKWIASDKPYGKDKKNNSLSILQQQNEGLSDDDELDTNKLLIKNVAFQTTTDELNRLFNQFGRVVALRAPKKLNGTLRGFCFVEYASMREAAHALKVLSETHLYGRRLVIEPSYDQQIGIQNEQDLV